MVDLCGNWTMKDLTDGKEYPSVVPSCNYLELQRCGRIPDPFAGTNEKELLWVAEHDWSWSRAFEADEALLAAERAVLVCRQLDTLATVLINGEAIASSENCHVAAEFDITSRLRPGRNTVEIVIASPVRYIREMKKRNGTPPNLNGLDGMDHIRKPQCHFGWDWGPVLPPSGITGDIFIETRERAHIKSLRVTQRHEEGRVTAETTVSSETISETDGVEVVLTVRHPSGKEDVYRAPYAESVTLGGEIAEPELWWTRELSGKDVQPLYLFTVRLIAGGKTLSEKSSTVGLRTLELDRGKDECGENFRFILNGVPVFGKGANMIPTDSFITRTTDEDLAVLVHRCRDANFNMIRIWGGGYYASDEFMRLCDESGILVWHDFAFACMTYPFYNESFLSNVHKEVVYNVERLRDHPSLALWCGNNEIEAMSVNWMTYRNSMKWNEQFFYTILPRWVEELDGVTPYIPSTPCGDAHLKNVQSDNIGDTHLWAVWHGLQPLTYYRRRPTRFCSEFGFESLPDRKTIATFATPADMDLASPVFNSHQKCASGNKKMIYYIASRFRLPAKFEDYIYLSQVCQSECVADATEYWRRNRGRCNGSLYWQLNDCWPVCSWSGLDYGGNLKCLHYRAKEFFAPLSASVYTDKKTLRVWVLNDTMKARRLTLRLTVVNMDGTGEAFERTADFEAPALESREVLALPLAEIARRRELKGKAALVVFTDENGEEVSRRTLIFGRENKLSLPEADIAVKAEEREGTAHITLTADKFARFVGLYTPLTTEPFSDNFFDLMPGESRTVTIPLPEGVSAERFAALLEVEQAAAIRPGVPRIVENMKRAAIFLEPVNFFSYIYYRFLI